jgi:hypothetical protein
MRSIIKAFFINIYIGYLFNFFRIYTFNNILKLHFSMNYHHNDKTKLQ